MDIWDEKITLEPWVQKRQLSARIPNAFIRKLNLGQGNKENYWCWNFESEECQGVEQSKKKCQPIGYIAFTWKYFWTLLTLVFACLENDTTSSKNTLDNKYMFYVFM
jgi:hypothetical protein